jgi:hypothetical protein
MTVGMLIAANLFFVIGLFKLYIYFFPPNGIVAAGSVICFWLNIILFSHWNEHHRRVHSLSDRALEELESAWLETKGFYKSSIRPSIMLRLICGKDRQALLKGLHRVLEIREEILKRTKEKKESCNAGKIAKLEDDIKANKDEIAKLELELGKR